MKQFFKIEILLTKFFSYEKDNRYNHLALGIVGGLGHVFFGLYWTYIDPQQYESVLLRSVRFINLFSTNFHCILERCFL